MLNLKQICDAYVEHLSNDGDEEAFACNVLQAEHELTEGQAQSLIEEMSDVIAIDPLLVDHEATGIEFEPPRPVHFLTYRPGPSSVGAICGGEGSGTNILEHLKYLTCDDCRGRVQTSLTALSYEAQKAKA